MKQEIIPTNCPFCKSPIKKIPAGVSKKTGKEYSEFFACENKECNYTFNPNTTSRTPTKTVDANLLIMDELKDFRQENNERWDKLGEFLDKRLKDD